nr:hypothetical protein [uncultured Dyadobacter sp.]
MLDELKGFTTLIEGFDNLRAADKIDFFAYFVSNQDKNHEFKASDIADCFSAYKIVPYSNIPQYLRKNSNTSKPKPKKIKFLATKYGFHIEANFAKELKSVIKEVETPFINFTVDSNGLDWKPSDIPFLNSKARKSADFFTKLYFLLYHLENSVRKFLQLRLSSIIGSSWEADILSNVDLKKAQSIRSEVSLSEMLPERGENILFYCMWEDYAKIIRYKPEVFTRPKEADEVLAHLNSLSKVRNAIAHNTATVPKEYQDELTLFLKKYIKIMSKNHI